MLFFIRSLHSPKSSGVLNRTRNIPEICARRAARRAARNLTQFMSVGVISNVNDDRIFSCEGFETKCEGDDSSCAQREITAYEDYARYASHNPH